jgi:YrbI family 3-deoxy-D-manno-octulosonate 8-phosphate phosphatase
MNQKIAIIPARGGSKGIPKKNLKNINGVSLVRRSALNASIAGLDLIIVSTDSEQIAQEVKSIPKVVVHNRSQLTSSDIATTEDVVSEVLAAFKSEIDESDQIVLLQPTSPFTSREIISECISKVEIGVSSLTLVPATQFRWDVGPDNFSLPVNHKKEFRLRRQDTKSENIETGSCYSFMVKDYFLTRSRFSEKVAAVFQTEIEAVDIDTKIDLDVARALATMRPDLYINGKYFPIPIIPKMIITDFDGCLTNDSAILNEFGHESVTVNRKDGASISEITKKGIPIIILSSETNNVVTARSKKLGVECVQGVKEKLSAVLNLLQDNKVEPDEIWYIGNDLNDLEPVKHFFSLCPADAVQEIKENSDIILSTRGGEGIFVEVSNILKRGKP